MREIILAVKQVIKEQLWKGMSNIYLFRWSRKCIRQRKLKNLVQYPAAIGIACRERRIICNIYKNEVVIIRDGKRDEEHKDSRRKGGHAEIR